jgi:hypothetical protein
MSKNLLVLFILVLASANSFGGGIDPSGPFPIDPGPIPHRSFFSSVTLEPVLGVTPEGSSLASPLTLVGVEAGSTVTVVLPNSECLILAKRIKMDRLGIRINGVIEINELSEVVFSSASCELYMP